MSENYTVLAIDDEPINLSILCYELEDHGFEVLSAENGEQGWELLHERHEDIAVILLDRMMPKMDGMQFMAKLNEDDVVRHIPVIMQTAAAQDKQVVEGIEAGVYYYLTKPFKPEVLLSIVQAAIRDSLYRRRMYEETSHFIGKLDGMCEARFEIRTLSDAQHLATFLSGFYPDPEAVILGLNELLINAIEHGNLGISYVDKSELLMNNRWREEIKARLVQDRYKNRVATVHYIKGENHIGVTIKDEGKGFDWRQYLDFNPGRMTDLHGRGIAIARKVSFDDLTYNDTGNEVETVVYVNPP